VVDGKAHPFGFVTVIPDERKFEAPLESEHKTYTIHRNGGREIKFMAQVPLVVKPGEKVEGYVKTSQPNITIVNRRIWLEAIPGTNYASATVKVRGQSLGRATLTLKVKKGSTPYKARVPVEVIDRPPKQTLPQGNSIDIKFLREGSDGNPAYWDGSVLYVYAKHPMIAPHLGSESEGWPGQNEEAGRAIMDHLLARSIARKACMIQKTGSFDYQGESDEAVISGVDGELNTMMTRIYKRIQ